MIAFAMCPHCGQQMEGQFIQNHDGSIHVSYACYTDDCAGFWTNGEGVHQLDAFDIEFGDDDE